MTDLDPDPLHVEEDELWDPAAGAWVPRPSHLGTLLAGVTYGAIVGFVAGVLLASHVLAAAPRDARLPSLPVTDGGHLSASVTTYNHEAGWFPGRAQPDRPTRDRDVSAPLGANGRAASHPSTVAAAVPASMTGTASFYDDGPGLYAAVHSWHWGDRPYRLTVTANGRSVVVTVRDHCGCPGGRLIDLSPAAFARLAPLSVGLVRVTIR